MQGTALNGMLTKVREKLSMNGETSVLIGVDLNGVDGSDRVAAQSALFPALSQIDVLHLNEDEAAVLTSASSASDEHDASPEFGISNTVLSQISSFHDHGCAVVLLSLGSRGAFVSITPDAERLQLLSSVHQPCAVMTDWIPGTKVCIPAFKIAHGEINANGAGDALFSGFCLAASSWAANKQSDQWKVTPEVAGKFASLVAWQRCDAKTRDGTGMKTADLLIDMIQCGDLPDAIFA
jgi:sugar/nucleoside kinase (ribokinase family)